MLAVEQILQKWQAAICGDAELRKALPACYCITVRDKTKVQSWSLSGTYPQGILAGEERGDCVLELTGEDFVKLASGDKNPQLAYNEGTLRLGGKVELFLDLAPLFSSSFKGS